MERDLLNFADFNRRHQVFEAKASGQKTTSFFAASNPTEIKGQNRFIAEVSNMEPKALEDLLNKIIAKGSTLASKLAETMAKRKELDSGPLKKKGEYYVGAGAWRINSAKLAKEGKTPESVTYFDPQQEELLAKYFGAESEKSDVSIGPDGEIQGMDMEYADRPEDNVEQEQEREYEPVLAGKSTMKYLDSIYEQDDFTLGPPESAKNAVVLDVPGLIEELVDNFMLETRENVMIWGAPGIGKTEVVKQVARRAEAQLGKEKGGIPVIVITLATKAAYDISGIPIQIISSEVEPEGLNQMVVPDKYRGKVGMDFAYPAWLPAPDDTADGILFFDEINRADPDVMGAALTLLLDRVSGSYKMPDSWRIWAAGNREMDGPVKPFEGAMASRFLGGHFHLVPTVEAWSDWAKTAKFKGTEERYIPDEFLSFIRLKDVESGTGTEISNLGKTYRVKFEYFYNWDEAAAASTGGGKMEGFPTPRTWTKSFSTIYQVLKQNDALMDKVSSTVDPEKRVISVFGLATLDPKLKRSIIIKLSAVVGTVAADAFMIFLSQLARLNDADGTLVEKIDRIFFDPSKPRPLLNIPKIGMDEVFGVLQAVQGKFEYIVSQKKMDTQTMSNWQQYLIDLEDNKKANPGDLQGHVSGILHKFSGELRKLSSSSNPDIKGKILDTMKKFASKYKDYSGKVNAL